MQKESSSDDHGGRGEQRRGERGERENIIIITCDGMVWQLAMSSTCEISDGEYRKVAKIGDRSVFGFDISQVNGIGFLPVCSDPDLRFTDILDVSLLVILKPRPEIYLDVVSLDIDFRGTHPTPRQPYPVGNSKLPGQRGAHKTISRIAISSRHIPSHLKPSSPAMPYIVVSRERVI